MDEIATERRSVRRRGGRADLHVQRHALARLYGDRGKESDLFPRVREVLSAEQRRALGERLERARSMVRTRPHPDGPMPPAVETEPLEYEADYPSSYPEEAKITSLH